MIAILKYSQGWLWLGWAKGRYIERYKSLLWERISPGVYIYFSPVGVGGGVSYRYSMNPASPTFFSTFQFTCFSAHVAECGCSRTPGRFSLFWCHRNQITLISIPGGRDRMAQLNEWLLGSFSPSQLWPVRGTYPGLQGPSLKFRKQG